MSSVDWNVVLYQPINIISALARSSMILVLLVILICGGMVAVLSMILTRSVSKPLSNLVANIEHIGINRLSVDVVSESQDEIGHLFSSFKNMVDRLNFMINEVYQSKILQQEYEMKALQAQINPHFLYNTLEYIRMYALSRNQEELADVVYAFSALLRNNTTQEKTKTLKEEIDFCEKYVYLFQMRYPDKIAYHVTIDPAFEQLELPKFTLQPLVENYFVHGIDYQRNDNAISIKAYKEADQIVIEVKDNGKGADPQQLAMIHEELQNQEIGAQTSIGIKNVHERLRGMFNGAYQMDVTSQAAAGFTVKIRLDEKSLQRGHEADV